MIQPRLVWELARKDLALFAADRRGMLLCFAVPVVLAVVFGAIFHQPGGDALRPRVWIVAQDDSAFTRRVVDSLESSPRMRAERCGLAAANRRLAGESCGVALVLPPGFGAQAMAGGEPRVEILHHPLSHVEARCAEGLFAEAVLREAARELLGPLAKQFKQPFAVERRSVPGGGALSENAYPHSFCGMTLQYLLFWGMDSGLLLLRERRQGIWRRLRAAPLSRGTLLAGKALATALVALMQVLATFAVGAMFFGVGMTGSAVGFGLMALAAALLSAATGLLVAALGGNEGRARSVSILAILTLSLLGGLWLPSFLLPGWAQSLSLALPTTWAARGLEGVCWQGMGLAASARCAGVLAAFSVAFLAFAWWRLVQADGPRSQGA